jgi:hypothetical protein
MINSIYLLAIIPPILALAITKSYDKFEKKDYSKKVYVKVGLMSYVTSVILLYLMKRYNLFFASPSLENADSGAAPWGSSQAVSATATTTGNTPSATHTTNVTNVPNVPNVPSTSTADNSPSVLSSVLKKIERVVKSTTQSGGNISNSMGNGTEVFHTGKPTF